MDLSKFKAGKMVLAEEDFSLRTLAEEVRLTLRHAFPEVDLRLACAAPYRVMGSPRGRVGRWDVLPLYDKVDVNGTELRAFAGNFLWSTGANEVAGRFCRGHFDLPMRNCTVELDGEAVVVDGVLVADLA